jgi:ubiquinol-cytochrome c reductase iron-sulfur subunit
MNYARTWPAGRIAGLRYYHKGANRAHRRGPAFLKGLPQNGPSAAEDFNPFGLSLWAGELSQQGERALKVTTVSSAAEYTRRDFLYIATGAVGAVGAAAVAVPLITQMNPDASTIAAGAPIEVDLSPIADGQIIKVFWRSKPIFIFHRTKKEIEEARNVNLTSLPDPEPDSERVKPGHEKWLVVIGICTHLGCIPLAHQGEYDGWFCPCHGSQYDTAGRIRKGPAPKNLYLPPYTFISDTKVRIG